MVMRGIYYLSLEDGIERSRLGQANGFTTGLSVLSNSNVHTIWRFTYTNNPTMKLLLVRADAGYSDLLGEDLYFVLPVCFTSKTSASITFCSVEVKKTSIDERTCVKYIGSTGDRGQDQIQQTDKTRKSMINWKRIPRLS